MTKNEENERESQEKVKLLTPKIDVVFHSLFRVKKKN